MLELCRHGYCIECLYRYLQSELAKMENEKTPASTDKSEEKEDIAEESDEKGKEKASMIDVQKLSDPQYEEKQATSSNATRDIRCPLSSCGCIVSLSDLKKGKLLLLGLLRRSLLSTTVIDQDLPYLVHWVLLKVAL